MEMNQEELKKLIRETVRETLREYFSEQTAPDSEMQAKQDYQTAFNEAMAQVARGEITEEQAGERIAEAYQKMNSPKNYSQRDFENQFEQFKSSVASWEHELSQLKGEGEPAEEMLKRMKAKADQADEEAEKALELKRMNEEAAKAKAEMTLKEMKNRLKGNSNTSF